jgi:hypothetical protein
VPLATTRHIRDRCLCLHAHRAARTLARRFDDALRLLALTNGQFSLLAALKPLARLGLMRIATAPEGRRGRVLTLTPAVGRCWQGPFRSGGARTPRSIDCSPRPTPRRCARLCAACHDR